MQRLRRLAFGLFLAVAVTCAGVVEAASVPWGVTTSPSAGRDLPSRHGYLPAGHIDGYGTEAGGFKSPGDLFIAPDGHLWIADTGNNRIIEMTLDGQYVGEIHHKEGPGALREPSGIFVDADGTVYVADTGNSRIVKFQRDGTLIESFSAPESPVLKPDFTYTPVKVVVDQRRYLYVVSRGTSEGLLQLNSRGEFRGFLASNRIEFDWQRAIARVVATAEQRERLDQVRPPEHTNLVLDGAGHFYTTTAHVQYNQLKKFNAMEKDVLNGDAKVVYGAGGHSQPRFSDVAVDERGIITLIDSSSGLIHQYDQEGRQLLQFGGLSDGQVGLYRFASSVVAAPDGRLFVLDGARGAISVLRPTPFITLVHEATALYHDGKYEAAADIWRDVLRLNSNFDLAHAGLAKALLRGGDYAGAMHHFRLALHTAGYSDAFGEVRHQFLRGNFVLVLTGALALFLAFWFLPDLLRRLRPAAAETAATIGYLAAPPIRGLFGPVREGLRLMRRPADVFWELKWLERGRYRHAFFLLALWYLAHVVGVMVTSFHFTPMEYLTGSSAGFLMESVTLLAPFLTWVVAQYLVATISDGEGRFRDVFIGSAYALTPYMLLAVPIGLLSNVLTLGEAVLYHGLLWVAKYGTVLLLVLQVKYTHNFTLGRTIFTCLAGLFAVLVIWGSITLWYGMSAQFIQFVSGLLRELVLR